MDGNNTSAWLKFALQQIAAESYLDLFISGQRSLVDVLQLGINRPTFTEVNYTRMTLTQASAFDNKYAIVDHHANDATGFSATLIQERGTNDFTLSFRSTEYRNQSEGGDWERDGQPGADGEIFFKGFAFGQLVSMERYYQKIKADGLLPPGATLTVTGFPLVAIWRRCSRKCMKAKLPTPTPLMEQGAGKFQEGLRAFPTEHVLQRWSSSLPTNS